MSDEEPPNWWRRLTGPPNVWQDFVDRLSRILNRHHRGVYHASVATTCLYEVVTVMMNNERIRSQLSPEEIDRIRASLDRCKAVLDEEAEDWRGEPE